MEAKKQWNELEPRVQAAVERAAKDVSNASNSLVRDLTDALKKLRNSLS
jgi:TRAP-type C4-dicarboxylate transport system substrate-binding protein